MCGGFVIHLSAPWLLAGSQIVSAARTRVCSLSLCVCLRGSEGWCEFCINILCRGGCAPLFLVFVVVCLGAGSGVVVVDVVCLCASCFFRACVRGRLVASQLGWLLRAWACWLRLLLRTRQHVLSRARPHARALPPSYVPLIMNHLSGRPGFSRGLLDCKCCTRVSLFVLCVCVCLAVCVCGWCAFVFVFCGLRSAVFCL